MTILVTVTAERMRHILDGDVTGGGHRHGSGDPRKSKFPADWDDVKIERVILDVANGSFSIVTEQLNGKRRHEGVRDGLRIRVVVDPRENTVVTAHPL